MKKIVLMLSMVIGVLSASELKQVDMGTYLKEFSYEERSAMKIRTPEMLALVEEGKAVVIDIRFAEEFDVWHMSFAKNIPLNELPNRLSELPKDKLIITSCPHNDRSNIARLFLTLHGYNAKYLNDGLLKAADFLRGENAKEFLEAYNANVEKKK